MSHDVKINFSPDPSKCEIILDGQELVGMVNGVSLQMSPMQLPVIQLDLSVNSIELNIDRGGLIINDVTVPEEIGKDLKREIYEALKREYEDSYNDKEAQ